MKYEVIISVVVLFDTMELEGHVSAYVGYVFGVLSSHILFWLGVLIGLTDPKPRLYSVYL